MPPQPIPGITEPMFLCEDNIYDLVSSYIPESTITKDKLWHWMSKNGSWGMYRDFTWDDISNIHQYRSFVRSTASRVCTVGYVRKSRTRE
ncbi:uncharacterized protein BYT42DRAFT_475993, partial [Radiomyces spectabilis]|uniref:uncharacterized protein n=1 Tax=Radiomyces spectabilis TaxID=64574 RepID=UPI00221EDD88